MVTTTSAPREPLDGGGAGVVPDVLADVDACLHAVDLEDGTLVAAGEVALLVEHAVVRKQDLPVDEEMLPSWSTAAPL